MTIENFQLNSKWRISEAVIVRKEDFGGIIFNRNNWQIHKLNHTGFNILSLIGDKELTIDEIISNIDPKNEWPEMASFDMVDFLNQLEKCKIITNGLIPSVSPSNKRSIFYQKENISVTKSSDKRLSRVLSAPLFLWWDVTAQCNLRCKQCYANSGKKSLDELSTFEATELVRELAEAGVFWLYILGGEPFLRKDLFEILQACCHYGLEVMISTNGWFIDREIATRLASVGVHHVRVSLDGATEETHDQIRGVDGSFRRAVRAVGYLRDAGIPFISLSPTFMEDNIKEVEQLIDLAYELKVDEISCGQVCSVGRGADVPELSSESAIYLRQAISRHQPGANRKTQVTGAEGVWEDKPYLRCVLDGKIDADLIGCRAGRDCAAISPSGVLRACLLYDFPFGDLRKARFLDIWKGKSESEPLLVLRAVKDGCKNCKQADICAGPCPMGNVVSVDERCRYASENW